MYVTTCGESSLAYARREGAALTFGIASGAREGAPFDSLRQTVRGYSRPQDAIYYYFLQKLPYSIGRQSGTPKHIFIRETN